MTRWLWIFAPLALVIVALTAFFRLVFAHEAGRRRVLPVMRPLYKHVFNPKSLRDAARGQTRWGVIHHVGRTSGRSCDTPVDAQLTREGMLIPLVYGAQSDWCRNVLAAGNCMVTSDGKDIELTEPQVISLVDAETQVSSEKARFWRGMGIEHLLSLQTVVPVDLESSAGSAVHA